MAGKKRMKAIEILEEHEIQALIRACSKRGPAGRRDRALIALMAFGGLRIAEALSIRPSQVKVKDGEVRILDLLGKGGKRRTVRIIPGREAPILEWIECRRDLELPKQVNVEGKRVPPPFICTISKGEEKQPGRPLLPRCVHAMMKRRAKKAGLEDRRIHPHALRHSFAFELHRRRVSVPAIQQLLGHAHPQITWDYINHISPRDAEDELERAFQAV